MLLYRKTYYSADGSSLKCNLRCKQLSEGEANVEAEKSGAICLTSKFTFLFLEDLLSRNYQTLSPQIPTTLQENGPETTLPLFPELSALSTIPWPPTHLLFLSQCPFLQHCSHQCWMGSNGY